ncbi:MAG: DNA recombination protein RmuC [Endozoicomonas sp. (ex Botrylloides leachii)]|nr:DNA recombination protein RmuC [Endozoicomonas sp. (ex Botrylloides leachii)]
MNSTTILFTSTFAVMAFIAGFVLANFKLRGKYSEQLAELKQISTEKEELKHALSEKHAQSSKLSDSVHKLRITQERLETENSHSISKIVELEKSLKQRIQEADDLRYSEQENRERLAVAQESTINLEQKIVEKTEILSALQKRLDQLQSSESDCLQTIEKIEARLDETIKQSSNYKQWWEETKKTLGTLQHEHNHLTKTHAELKATLTQKEKNFEEQFKLLEHNKKNLTKEFENLANKVLDEKGRHFKELNKESLLTLLNPIQNEMKGFKDVVEKNHKTESEQRIELKTELKNLQNLNRDITDQAKQLTNALQGQKKVQGNWGELMLENVLDGSGLRIGKDYKREVSFTTENGRQRPDAIVYLPQGKHMVIDAKTSLAAYTRYVNAADELSRKHALKEHTQAVSNRISELADRNYYRLPGLNSPEIVVMFIPVESAYVEALKHDETLYQRAIEHNILVATPTTLLTSLNIVRQLWRFEDQNKHTAELANKAEKFYSKLKNFLISMNDVGKKLDQAKTCYDKALGQLHSGKGNLIKQAAEFKDLGVAVSGELPTELVERANLELDYSPQPEKTESSF